MAYREVTNQSWGGRLVSSVGGALTGGLLFLVAFPVLFWNEGRAVHRAQDLAEGASNVVPVGAGKIDTANEGKLVHITAKATTDDTPADPDFGVKAPKAIRLVRKAEMFQYKEEEHSETRKKLGGGEETIKTYNYPTVWSADFLDSSRFHDPAFQGKNPSDMPYKSQTFRADKVTAGAFVLPTELADKIDDAKPFPVGKTAGDKEAGAPGAATKDQPKPSAEDAPNPAGAAGAEPPPEFKARGGEFYKGDNPDAPKVGDMRVSYQVVEPQTVSVVAVQQGSTLAPYHGKAGSDVYLLEPGEVDAPTMFKKAEAENETMTWILRAVGFLMMAIGLFLVMRPLSVLGDVVPFIGNMVGALLAVVAALIALAFSLITISIAWVYYRPLIGIPLLFAGIMALVAVFVLARRRRKAPAAGAV